MYVCVSLCDFVCLSLLLPFVLLVCLFCFLLFVVVCFLFMNVCVYVSLCDFVCLVLFLPFGLGFHLFVFVFFFLAFLPSCVAGRVLVLQPGVGPEPPRWESQVQDIGPPEASQPHVTPIGKSSPRDLCLNTKTQLHPKASKL